MDAACDIIRKKLCGLGWRPRERQIETLSGEQVWVVFSHQRSRSFSIQGYSQQEAWESAWQLVGDKQHVPDEPRMILPFPARVPSYHRAA